MSESLAPNEQEQQVKFTIEESFKRLDELFGQAFETNHPAALDYANLRIALKNAQEVLEIVGREILMTLNPSLSRSQKYLQHVVGWGLGKERKPDRAECLMG